MLYLHTLTALMGFVACTTGSVVRRAFNQTSHDGFPNPDKQQLLALADQAGGKLPGATLPKSLSNTSITTLQLIAFNELFEVAYFSSLLQNLTMNETGYNPPEKKKEIIEVIKTVRAQESFHALAVIAALETNKAFAPSSCKYNVPVTNLTAAVNVAETFTDVVLGALQGAAYNFALDSKARALVPLIGAIIGQEGEQNGAYRLYLDRVPSSSPFLTAVPAPFAWSALQLFVVPGSCPYNLSKVDLPIFPALTVNGGPIAVVEPKNQTLMLMSNLTGSADAKKYVGKDGKDLYATFTSGQQLPYSMPAKNVSWNGSIVSFEAEFPYTSLVAHGFSHVALTNNSNISSVNAIANYTLAAPGIIQVNNTLQNNTRSSK